ncbi:LacI family DNA-binding transcriptional regulator [Nitratireductor aquimarinus]|uniref:LacI family DNA-binding transcriptional regulator n=1 Tax=Nitratireductor aquimarinus TaxID=889300 RepID=UPI001A8D58F5|nr:LacI family DNA-binding transcriptional regulator [Nitratireductor aquimarinus]MBN8245726.1 LacI family DNA-binding transcriptional regulator [Nitratireductor aquimarinus]MBY6134107.1 LacI family DNA-binding transcriptional regulator [Nitratireductor aquimarinus]MCA1305202.1 LacI family DNA-binding transcriptional regulator [Nitratireductor aquimarinus]
MNESDDEHPAPPPINGRVSSYDVAARANVSRSAVSRTFTLGASVSKSTRSKVMKAAKELGYHPNAIARSLSTRRSRIVAVIVADLENPFYAKSIACVSVALQNKGYTTLLMVAENSRAIDDLIPRLLSYQVDGVVVASSTLSSTVSEYCLTVDLPVVQFNRYTKKTNVSAVYCDNFSGGVMVAELLVKTGHVRVAYVAGIEDTSSNIDRERGLVSGLERHGRVLHSRSQGGYTYAGGYAAANEILGSGDRPDAVFCANDIMALALIDVASNDFGLSVPGDLSVIGFDNIPVAGFAKYGLTTIDQNIETMAAQAAEILVSLISGSAAMPVRLAVPCELIERSSVGRRHLR